MSQTVKGPASAHVMISWFVYSSSRSGSALTAQSLEPSSGSVSPSLSAPLPLALSLSKTKQKNIKIIIIPFPIQYSIKFLVQHKELFVQWSYLFFSLILSVPCKHSVTSVLGYSFTSNSNALPSPCSSSTRQVLHILRIQLTCQQTSLGTDFVSREKRVVHELWFNYYLLQIFQFPFILLLQGCAFPLS